MTEQDVLRAAATLRRLGFPVPAGAAWAGPVFAAVVVRVDGEPLPTWQIGDLRVRHRKASGLPLDHRELVCACGGRTCAHVAAVLLCEAGLSRAPDWELVLADLPAPPQLGDPVRGQLVCEVHAPTPAGIGLEPELVIERSGAAIRAPRSAAELAALVGAGEAEREVHAAWLALAHARRLDRGQRQVLVRHLTRSLLGPLARLGRVRLDGRPITASPDVISPVLVAERDGDDLVLAWRHPLRVVWPDVGVALGTDGVLRPLPEALTAEQCARLADALPRVPGADLRRFVDRVVVDQGLPVELPADIDPLTTPDGRAARLVLSEQDGELRIELQLAYRLGPVEIIVRPSDGSTAPKPGGGRIRRDLGWEADAVRRFGMEIGGAGDPAFVLATDPAIDWLRDELPALSRRWEVHGEERLLRLQVRGTASPHVRFDEGTDWFDLDARFAVGGQELSTAAVLASWRAGARFVRLADGALAELPRRWLERHGHTLVDLHEVHRVGRRMNTWDAWQMSDLLAEAGGSERWQRLTEPARVRRVEPPPGLRATLRGYQRDGLDWLCFLRDHGLHGVLADEMGLGKTLQALAAILEGRAAGDPPALVVAPTSVIGVWEDEAARFAPELRVVRAHGPQRARQDLAAADVVVTSYPLLRRDVERLASVRWSWVVLDEGRHIKNPASQTARAARRLRADHRLVLSGTPLENDLIELWSLFQFLLPGWLGRRSWFHSRYTVAQGRRDQPGERPALDELRARIRPFLLRRRKREVATELPPKTEITVKVTLSEPERALYERIRATVRAEVVAAKKGETKRPRGLMLEGLTRLRQACTHPRLLPFPEARAVRESAKFEALFELIDDALPSGSRMLVFSQWVRLLDQIQVGLEQRGIEFLRLDGSTKDRRGVVNTFQTGEIPIFLISTLAGGTGLTLTAADVVVHTDPWWNPAIEDQATDRAHRIGQERPVTVYRLIAADTVEERVVALSDHKRELFADLMERETLDVTALSTDDLLALLEDPAPPAG